METKANALPEFTHPHGWTWRNSEQVPSSIHVEPAFVDWLGDVYIRIDHAGEEPRAIWLTREVMEQFIAAMRSAADAPEYDD